MPRFNLHRSSGARTCLLPPCGHHRSPGAQTYRMDKPCLCTQRPEAPLPALPSPDVPRGPAPLAPSPDEAPPHMWRANMLLCRPLAPRGTPPLLPSSDRTSAAQTQRHIANSPPLVVGLAIEILSISRLVTSIHHRPCIFLHASCARGNLIPPIASRSTVISAFDGYKV